MPHLISGNKSIEKGLAIELIISKLISKYEKKESTGFAFLLLGIIFAVRQELISEIEIILGICGLYLVAASDK